MLTSTLRASVVTVTVLSAASSHAEAERPHVVICLGDGVASSVEAEAEDALGDTVSVDSRYRLDKEWAALGNAGYPHLDAPTASGRLAVLEEVRQAARSAGLQAVVFVSATGPGRAHSHARVVVFATSLAGRVVDTVVPVGPKASTEPLRHLLGDAMTLLAPEQPAPPPETTARREGEATQPTVAESSPSPGARIDAMPAEADRPEGPASSATDPVRIDAAYGVELGLRDLKYNDRLTNNLRSYQIIGVPLGALHADFAPFARLGMPVLSQLGVVAGYASAFDLTSDVGGARVPTSWYRFSIGPRFRTDPLAKSPVRLDVSLTYEGETFGFEDTAPALSAQLPSVAYRFLRGGLGVRVPLGRITLLADAAYMDVVSAGAVADRMPGTTVAGIDADIGASFAVIGGLEVRLGARYRRLFYDFHPRQADTYIAGGALDQFGGAQIALALVK